jgi:EpsI family protein
MRFGILVIALVAGIGVTFGMVANPFRATGKRPLAKPFESFPREFVEASGVVWNGQDRKLTNPAVNIAGMDEYLRRDYRATDSRMVQLFVSYYGNMRAGIDTIYHNPTVCFPSHGWNLEEERPAEAGTGPDRVPVTMYRFSKGPKEYIVLNFFIVNDRVLGRSPREDPLELAKQKFTLSSDPGYYVQVQVIADGGPGGRDGASTALSFLDLVRSQLFSHF